MEKNPQTSAIYHRPRWHHCCSFWQQPRGSLPRAVGYTTGAFYSVTVWISPVDTGGLLQQLWRPGFFLAAIAIHQSVGARGQCPMCEIIGHSRGRLRDVSLGWHGKPSLARTRNVTNGNPGCWSGGLFPREQHPSLCCR